MNRLFKTGPLFAEQGQEKEFKMSEQLTLGQKASLENIVTAEMTADRFSDGPAEKFPAVLATPFLIADLERACALLLTPLLEEGQLSVGAHIDIRHLAPTAVGGRYTATATFIENRSPLFWFEVVAEDSAGIIGKGRIARAIVSEAAILARADQSVSGS